MVREDWVSVGIPRGVIDELDLFLKTEDAKKIGVMNRQQIITLLLRKFIDDGIKLLSKSDNSINLTQNQLENKFDEKIGGILDIFINYMAVKDILGKSDKERLEKRRHSINKLLSSKSTPKNIKEILSKLQKE